MKKSIFILVLFFALSVSMSAIPVDLEFTNTQETIFISGEEVAQTSVIDVLLFSNIENTFLFRENVAVLPAKPKIRIDSQYIYGKIIEDGKRLDSKSRHRNFNLKANSPYLKRAGPRIA